MLGGDLHLDNSHQSLKLDDLDDSSQKMTPFVLLNKSINQKLKRNRQCELILGSKKIPKNAILASSGMSKPTFHNRNLLVPVVVIIEGIILLEHVTLNLKLRFASNMYQIYSMHVQVLSASPAVKGIPAQHFPNLPRKRREWNDDYCMSCIFSSLLTN